MSMLHFESLIAQTRKFLRPVVMTRNKWCFASFKTFNCFKCKSNLLFRRLIIWKYNTLQYTHSMPFQNLTSQNDLSFNNSKVQKHIAALLKEFNEAKEKIKYGTHEKDLQQLINSLEPLAHLKCERDKLTQQVQELDLFVSDIELQKDKELLVVAQDEKKTLSDRIHQCEIAILQSLLPESSEDDNDIIVELSAGVGGQEAMLFTKVMFDIYCKFAAYKNWNCEIIRFDETSLGGLRNAHISISGENAYKMLKFESGVHRVQRIPKTEKSGRVHTSTMTVAVLPQPTDIDIVLNRNDIEMQFMRSSGAGGQHVNKTDSCVRLLHVPTGIAVECQMERCQHKNRQLALKFLRAKLYQRKLDKIQHETSTSRRLQVGTAARSDKVRTYNFPQDRITDHRIHKNMHNIELFLQGGEQLNELLSILQDWSSVELLNEVLGKYS